MYFPPSDLAPLRTGDGSFTLDSPSLGEHYHSIHGAVEESRHVYIRNGLRHARPGALALLEVGLGSGLNALLTWIDAEEQRSPVDYFALEPWPLSLPTLRALDHLGTLARPDLAHSFEEMMMAKEDEAVMPSPFFRFQRSPCSVQLLDEMERYDLIYFDAFAPGIQPEMWTLDVFRRMHRAMRPGATLVTYCAKGDVRRTMVEAELLVERLPGPPHKQLMIRATRPL